MFLATHRRLGRLAALKVLAPEYAGDDVFRERFIRESQLAASLEHPDIVPIYDADEDGGTLFMAMRFVEGPDLRHVLRRQRRLTTHGTAHIVESVASALDAAHAAGLVHRDVKPANILIQEPGGQIFLSDFGIAQRRVSDGLTKAGTFVGSVEYCSPEQIQGEPLTGGPTCTRSGAWPSTASSGSRRFGRRPGRGDPGAPGRTGPRRVDGDAGNAVHPRRRAGDCAREETRRALRERRFARSRSSSRDQRACRAAQPSRSQLPIFSRRRLTSRHPGSSCAERLELPAELPEELVEFFAGVPRLVVPEAFISSSCVQSTGVSGSRSSLSMPTRADGVAVCQLASSLDRGQVIGPAEVGAVHASVVDDVPP